MFIGSGFSQYARGQVGGNLPIGQELVVELGQKFGYSTEGINLAQICTIIESTRKKELVDYLIERFTILDYNPLYKNIENINIRAIFTTNIDNLIHCIYKESSSYYLNDVNFRGISIPDKEAIDYYSLHGSVVSPEGSLKFGVLEIASALADNPTDWFAFRLSLSKRPYVFWGYSLQDSGTLQSIRGAIKDGDVKDYWIVLPPDNNNQMYEYVKALGFKVICSDTIEFLEHIGTIGHTTSGPAVGRHSGFLVEGVIPKRTSIASPIKRFYQGGTPTWNDIYSKQVCRTHYYDIIRNNILGGKNVLIAGSPATGKSTLLMQLASSIEVNREIRFVENITGEKANLLINKAGTTPVTLFIDNCMDNIDALRIFAKTSNFQVVGADRDYNYLGSLDRIEQNLFEIIDVTELNPNDQQLILERIPADMKCCKPRDPQIGSGHNYSLFEFIETNCKTARLDDRFGTMINVLSREDHKVIETVILSCYLHICRTLLSMDVLIAYWRDNISDYRKIYDLIDYCGKLISPYVGELADTEQDYYKVRSVLVGTTIIDVTPPDFLKRVLVRFFKNVAPASINRYDTFKRFGHDAKIFVKAFYNIEDGKSMYDLIYKKSKSPFVLQQKALYLSRKRYFADAFSVIDQALAIAGSNHWSIKNSHAIILFKANIDNQEGPDVKMYLDESMQILIECHNADRAKTFHAITFADHANQYYKRYRDNQALAYLEKAREWLAEESRNTRNLQKVKSLQRVINNCLYSY